MPFSPYEWAANRCARKECCVKEIACQLASRGVSLDDAMDIIDRLEAEGFLSAKRYAEAFVRDKFRFDHWGRVKIAAALQQKGIDPSIADIALLECIDEVDYIATLREVIASRRRALRADTPYALQQKVARSVIARGFEPDLVFRLLRLEDWAEAEKS